jgi:hypothetical protein
MDKIKLALMATFLFFQGIQARQPYHATITVDTTSATVSDPNLVDLSRDLKSDKIEALIPIYTPTSAVSIAINLRGVMADATFAANSTDFVVTIPQTGVTQTFQGATREESILLFKESVRDGGPKHKLLKAYARYSPIDPIAGNPNSLMAQMAQSDYAMGLLSPLSGCGCGWTAQPILHQFQTGFNGIRAFSDGYETTAVTAPLRYSYSPDRQWALIIDAPFTYFRNGGASSVFGSLGVGLRLPITEGWSLTPLFRLGSGGSLDLCTSGNFVSAGITSVFEYKISDYVLRLTDYVGYFASTNLWLTGVNFNYHLHNYVFKNGLSMTTCEALTLCDRTINFSALIVDTCFTRDRLFIRHYDEVEIAVIANYINPCLDYDCASIGFSYQFGEKKYRGYCLKMTYQF